MASTARSWSRITSLTATRSGPKHRVHGPPLATKRAGNSECSICTQTETGSRSRRSWKPGATTISCSTSISLIDYGVSPPRHSDDASLLTASAQLHPEHHPTWIHEDVGLAKIRTEALVGD